MVDAITNNVHLPVVINIFSLIILFIFLTDSRHKNRGIKSDRYRYFLLIVTANILVLVTDSVNFLVLGHPEPVYRTTQIVATTLFYAIEPLPAYFFLRFTDVVLGVSAEKRNRLRFWYYIPFIAHLIISLATPFTGWFFRIDELNNYHRGSILWLSFILSFMLMFLAAGKTLLRFVQARKASTEMAKNIMEYGWLLRFTVIPIIGGIIQIFFNNVTYVWHATVIALLLLYINNQNAEITTDTLTGLFNRRQAFAYFERFVREREKEGVKSVVAVVVLDINSFKAINDQYGHIMGDEAIITVARCLETEFQWDDFICRFGGDEFLVITKHGRAADIKAVVERVNNHMHTLFEKEVLPFDVFVSAGYAQLSKKNKTMDQLFQKADAMMFEQKAKLLRRSTDKHS